MGYCEGCFKKQKKIDQLEARILHLECRLRRLEEKTKEGYFGSSTPSSKLPFKKNSESKNNGGAKKGHKGNGRKSIKEAEADGIEYHSIEGGCPYCGGELEEKDTINRSVIDLAPVKAKKVLHKCKKYQCVKCKKTIQSKPRVLPRSLYGNGLIAQSCVMHYLEGTPVGRVESILGNNVVQDSLFDVFHRVANIWGPTIERIADNYKQALVKHADETGWRIDGHSGYAWLFCSEQESIFKFKNTRSSKVPGKVFGNKQLPGVLVVDRYSGYNKAPCKIQYCYAHLLRKVKDLEKKFSDSREVACFVEVLAPLLAKAMRLRTKKISNNQYYKQARNLKKEIIKVARSPSCHFGIKEIQRIFLENKDRLYHWVTDRKVPPDNNKAEREIRPSVIARKVSFGSGSEKGAKTRSILMSVLHTAKKRLKSDSIVDWFKEALDEISLNPSVDSYSLLPTKN